MTGRLVEPLVSVAMTTFNHERWIRQSVESVLAQRATFPFELIIGEDCSTDGTRDVVRALAAADPDRVTLVLPDRNLGRNGLPLFEQVLARAGGRYVASLDGDDFWTDLRKLEKQVRFLEENADCVLCFHNVATMGGDEQISPGLYTPTGYPRFSTISDLLQDNAVPACAPMMRREAIVPTPAWYADCRFGDWALYIIAAEHGRIGYLDEVMGVYRSHGGGLWSGLDRFQQIETTIQFLEEIDEKLGGRHTPAILRSISKLRQQLARLRAEA